MYVYIYIYIYICVYIYIYIYIYNMYIYMYHRKLSYDAMLFGSFPIWWLFFDMRSFEYNRPMRK